jgi:hypothetical protein
MRRHLLLFPLTLVAAGFFVAARGSPGKEFLTDKEIAKIQDAQEIDARVKVYMDAAALRLKTAEERLVGKESEEGDPLEFFTPEDMLDGYYRILKSVMMNLDEAFQKPGQDRRKLEKALKTLKGATEDGGKQLEILKKIAEEKQKEELWNLVNRAIDITDGAHEGAEYGLSKLPAPPGKKKKDSRS